MIEYRKATISDAGELARLRSIMLCEADQTDSEALRAENEKANLAYLTSAMAEDSFVAWLAVDNGVIVGTSGLSFYVSLPSLHCSDGKVAYIKNMYTIPEYREQGIATELLSRITEEALCRGYRKMALNASNAGKPIYERYGFKEMGGNMVYLANLP